MARKRFLQIDSTQLAEDTADLTDAEFRAFILIQAWGNECMYHESDFVVNIAKSRLPSVAPNRRNSVATSARVVRELSAKRAWGVHDQGAKWVISVKKDEQKHGSEATNKKKNKNKNKNNNKAQTGTDPPATQSEVQESPKPDAISKHPDAIPLCEFFRDELVRLVPGFTPPSPQVFANSWVVQMDRLLRLDGPERKGIEAPQIKAVIEFVTTDEEFEQANVQCPNKLRARFAKLEIKTRRGHKVPGKDKFQLIAEAGAQARQARRGGPNA